MVLGAFLIPYAIMVVIVGIPLFMLESAIGQFASLGPIALFKVSPLFKGVGYAMMFTTCIGTTYYAEIIAECFYYLFVSFNFIRLPWTFCDPEWSSPNCIEFFSRGNKIE